MINQEGESLETALTEFVAFVQNLPIIGYNTNFDMRFLQDAAKRYNIMLANKFSDALPMVRRAWPGLPSYKLSNIVKDDTFLKWCQAQSLSDEGIHRALGDCKRTLLIYIAAAEKLNFTWEKQVSNKSL
jgi:CRISPR-associated protein Cas2